MSIVPDPLELMPIEPALNAAMHSASPFPLAANAPATPAEFAALWRSTSLPGIALNSDGIIVAVNPAAIPRFETGRSLLSYLPGVSHTGVTARLSGPPGAAQWRWPTLVTKPGGGYDAIEWTLHPAASASDTSGDAHRIAFARNCEQRLRPHLFAQALRLTTREKEVMLLLLDGYTIPDISVRLNLAASTVRTHARSVYARTKVAGRADLTRLILG